MLEFHDENFKEEVLESEKPVLVDFWKPGCGPCEQVAPIVEKVEEEMGEKAKVGKLNVLKNPETAKNYKIMGVPTLIIFKDGEAEEKAIGTRSKEVIVNKINSLL